MSVNFHLTARQKANLAKGKPVQLSHQQLTGQKADAIHQMSLPMTKKGFTKMEKAIKQGKGFRINPSEYLGGDIFSSIGNKIKKSANDVGDTLKKSGKTISSGITTVSDVIKEEDVGGMVEDVKKYVPKSVVKEGIKASLIAGGTDPNEAEILSSTAAGAMYSYDFGEAPSKKNGLNALKGALKDGATAGLKSSTKTSKTTSGSGFKGSGFKGSALPLASPMSFKGSGFKGSGFQGSGITENLNKMTGGKGSPEMKEKMAKLRAMRGKKGGSFKDS